MLQLFSEQRIWYSGSQIIADKTAIQWKWKFISGIPNFEKAAQPRFAQCGYLVHIKEFISIETLSINVNMKLRHTRQNKHCFKYLLIYVS